MQEREQSVFWKRIAWLTPALTAVIVWIALDTWLGFTQIRPRTVEIPNYCGEVADSLELAEWLDVRVEYRYDDEAPAGVVLSQTPRGGARRKLSDAESTCKLTLVVSLGKESVVLPDVTGGDVREALARLHEMGIAAETVMQTGSADEGTVLFMKPCAGTEVPRGTTVTLTVSAGEPLQTVKVPDVCGMTRADALVCLWLSQLTVGEVCEIVSEQPSGTVVRQSHRTGTIVMAGTKITLYVSMQDDERHR